MSSYTEDLLSDAESYLIAARKGDLKAAQEALDAVNLYQTLRQDGEGPEPWLTADAYAGDMETEALALIERLTPRPAPVAAPHCWEGGIGQRARPKLPAIRHFWQD